MKKTVAQLAQWLNIDHQAFGDVLVTGISIDTRTIQQGDLFIPFRGEAVNGHRFVQQAIDSGAAAALWMKDEPNPPKDVPLIFVDDSELALQQMAAAYRAEHKATFIGITGSNGKTSSKDILAGTLSPYFKVQKTIGNFNNQLGLPITILQLDEDTEVSVLEMGMSGFGEIEFLTKLARPHYTVITNIGEAHMRDLGSRAGIAKAKFEIVDGMAAEGKLFYDGDEPLLRELVTQRPDIEAIAFGFEAGNALTASAIETNEAGSTFTVQGLLNGSYFISVLGKHQVKNTLNAMLLAQALGLTEEQIRASLRQVVLTDMRMQQLPGVNGSLFINDAYNAAPTSVAAAIDFMKQTTLRQRKWLVLGDMLELGEDEQLFHEQLADLLDDSFEKVLLYGPRMGWLHAKLQNRLTAEQLVYSETDYAPLIDIVRTADAETVVLYKGSRGMKLETIIAAFND